VSDPVAVLDPFARGFAAGAMAATSLGVWRSRVSPQARLVTLALGLSTIAWLVTESSTLWSGLRHAAILIALAYPVGGLFWLFIVTVFEDRPVRPLMLAPPAVLLVLGFVMGAAPPPASNLVWSSRKPDPTPCVRLSQGGVGFVRRPCIFLSRGASLDRGKVLSPASSRNSPIPVVRTHALS
jgi:hypothetical protein